MLRKLAAVLALACTATAVQANEQAIRRGIAAMLGAEVKVEGITKTGILGLYEVRVATEEGTRIVYADEAASYFFIGNIIEAKTETDITEGRLRRLNAIRVADLPLAQAFKLVRGKGTRQLVYFSDPRCPYCRRLDQELAKVDDLTVHVFLIPIIAPDSAAVSKAVWCAPDRGKAWLDLMLKEIEPPAPKANCETPIEKNLALSRKYRINGTPTLVFADGQRVAGLMSAGRLAKMLDEAAGRAK
jgi:thiol:disulfide interchange protein DsbC